MVVVVVVDFLAAVVLLLFFGAVVVVALVVEAVVDGRAVVTFEDAEVVVGALTDLSRPSPGVKANHAIAAMMAAGATAAASSARRDRPGGSGSPLGAESTGVPSTRSG